MTLQLSELSGSGIGVISIPPLLQVRVYSDAPQRL
jgi:hypothetical protein